MHKFIAATGLILLIFFVQEAEASAQMVVTADPQRSEVMRGERVRITCEVKDSDPSTHWRFSWMKRSKGQEIALSAETEKYSSVYTLNSVVESDSAQYICEAKAEHQTITSSPYTLTVTSLPPVILTLQTGWTDMFNTERAALLCQIQDLSPGWMYKWYRDGKALPVGTDKDTYEIQSAVQSHSGKYSCRGEHKDRGLYTDISSIVTLRVYALPSAVLTVQPVWSTYYSSEKVTLTCEVQWRLSKIERRYVWYRNEKAVPTGTEKELKIQTLDQLHSGSYYCIGLMPGRIPQRNGYSESSNQVILKVEAPPSAVLTVQPVWSTYYTSEKVTLTCEVQSPDTEWGYLWYRDGVSISTVDSRYRKEFIIPALDLSHGGRYFCKGELQGRRIFTKRSNDVTLSVKALPPVALTLQTGWTDMFNTERAALLCQIQDISPVWMYKWYRDGKALPVGTDKDTYEIQSAVQSDSGTYSCRGEHKDRGLYTTSSSTVTLTVYGLPSAILTVQPVWSTFYTSEKVTLTCEVQWRSSKSERRYVWYRDGKTVHTGTEKELKIQTLDQSHSGSYSCAGEIPDRIPLRKGKTEESRKVTLSVDALPPVALTLQTGWTDMFNTERAALLCQIQDISPVWMYKWYRDGKALPVGTDKDTYEIQSAVQSDSGTYSCRGEHKDRGLYTTSSSTVTLTVYGLPSAILTVQPVWSTFYTSEKVTLTCEVQWRSSESERRYVWYRDGKTVHTGTEKELKIQTLDQSHSGNYSCAGEIPDRIPLRKGKTEESKKVTLSVDGLPSAGLTVQPVWSTFYTSEKVTLTCEVQWRSSESERRYVWYRDGKTVLTGTEKELKIQTLDQSHSGSYSCAGEIPDRIPLRKGKTEESKKVTLSVDARPVAVLTLETPWTGIFRTDSLSLRCSVEGNFTEGNFTGWSYTWYRNGQPLKIGKDTLTLKPENGTDRSEYRCRGNSTGNPSFTDISEAFREHNIVLKRKVLVSLASTVLLGILIIILGCIALRVRRKSAYKTAPQNDLFISSRPAENLDSDSEQFSAAKPSADIKDACSVELYSVVDLDKNKEVLPPKRDPEELQSFKAIE